MTRMHTLGAALVRKDLGLLIEVSANALFGRTLEILIATLNLLDFGVRRKLLVQSREE